MKKQFFLLGVVATLAACSSPKYVYTFDRYDYSSGRRKPEKPFVQQEAHQAISPISITQKDLSASVSSDIVIPEKSIASISSLTQKEKQFKNMTRDERKDFKKELKKKIKNYTRKIGSANSIESVSATKELDDELKLAIIFGAIGITLTVLGGINTVFWVLGVVGLVIGLVFFIRWISRQ